MNLTERHHNHFKLKTMKLSEIQIGKTYFLCLMPELRFVYKVEILEIIYKYHKPDIRFKWLNRKNFGLSLCFYSEIGLGETKVDAVNNYSELKNDLIKPKPLINPKPMTKPQLKELAQNIEDFKTSLHEIKHDPKRATQRIKNFVDALHRVIRTEVAVNTELNNTMEVLINKYAK